MASNFDARWTTVTDLVDRFATPHTVAHEELLTEIDGLLHACGFQKSELETEIDALLAEEEISGISGADTYHDAARADDPLDPAVCNDFMRSHLNALVRRSWQSRRHPGPHRSLAGLGWSDLTDGEKSDVKAAFLELATHACKSGTLGRPHLGDLDTAVSELAGIYWRHVEMPKLASASARERPGGQAKARSPRRHPLDLPIAKASRFVQFLEAVLVPVAPAGSVSRKALSARWDRVRKLEREGVKPPEEDDC